MENKVAVVSSAYRCSFQVLIQPILMPSRTQMTKNNSEASKIEKLRTKIQIEVETNREQSLDAQ